MDARVKCPKCARDWPPQTEQAWAIGQWGECIACRFLPRGPNNPGSGEGTAAEFESIPRRPQESDERERR